MTTDNTGLLKTCAELAALLAKMTRGEKYTQGASKLCAYSISFRGGYTDIAQCPEGGYDSYKWNNDSVAIMALLNAAPALLAAARQNARLVELLQRALRYDLVTTLREDIVKEIE